MYVNTVGQAAHSDRLVFVKSFIFLITALLLIIVCVCVCLSLCYLLRFY